MPLSQLRKNVGYLLGQGISRQHILEMWKQRAGLMVESLKTLHGQMLALQLAGRPLQVTTCSWLCTWWFCVGLNGCTSVLLTRKVFLCHVRMLVYGAS